MLDISKMTKEERHVYYCLPMYAEKRFLSQEEFSAYCALNNEEKEKYDKILDQREKHFPIKGFLIFISKLIAALLFNALFVFFPFFININLFRQTGGIFLTELFLTVVSVPLAVLITKNDVEKYGLKKRHALVFLYILIMFGFALLFSTGSYNLHVYMKYTNTPKYTDEQIVDGYYFSILRINTGLVGLVAMIIELKKVTFFSCRRCNRLNILTVGDYSKYSDVREHTHYEKGYYQESKTDFKKCGDPFGTPILTAKTQTYIPGKTVSDGMYKHTSYTTTYCCKKCGKTRKKRYEHYETKL